MSRVLTTYTGERSGVDYERAARERQGAPLNFYAELFMAHSPETVWSFFSDLGKWTTWSPICRGCRSSAPPAELRLGSILEISFAVCGVVLTVPSTVVEFEPPTTIAWQGQKFGVEAIHRYRFRRRNGGTLLCNEETFSGIAFPLTGLLSAWYRASQLSRRSLEGIRRELSPGPTGVSS